jgi:nucleotide-binding universal stress UspA family protein
VKNDFKNILVPIDFTVNTEVAIRKALTLSEGSSATIHLLHVSTVASMNIFSIYQYFANYSFRDNEFDMKVAKGKLETIRDYIASLRKDIEVVIWVLFNPSIEAAIIQMACRLNPDLIIIGKNSHHSWLPFLNTVVPSWIALKTGSTVLTAKPGAMNNAIRTIVVPISDNFPSTKISVINTFRNRFPVNVRLVTFLTAQNDLKVIPGSLLNAYRLLRTNVSSNVSYEILYGHNKARAVLRYCNKINADMVIVNPGIETKVGWLNKQMSDLLPTNSKTQILAVHPLPGIRLED